jgi:hypothetical protein
LVVVPVPADPVAGTPARTLLASGSDDGIVRVWDPVRGGPVGDPLVGHTDPVGSLVVVPVPADPVAGTPARTLLASGGIDGTLRVWDPVRGGPVGDPLTGHTRGVGSLVVVPVPADPVAGTPARILLASGGADGTVRVWEVLWEVAVPRVPAYASDTGGGAGGDLLDRDREAVAVADLLTSRSARPPLAVGVFGQWGEGKSQFLELVYEAVAARTRAGGGEDPIAHSAVRQVRFNAWHYAETDLWAGLVAELFTQLAGEPNPGGRAEERDLGVEARQRSRLAAELVSARGVRSELAGARARLEALERARRGGIDLATVGAVWRSVDWRALVRRVAAAAGAGVVALLVLWVTRRGWIGQLRGWAVPAAGAVGGALASLRLAWRDSKQTRQEIREQAARLRDRLDTAIDVARAEVDALQRQLQDMTAAGQLAGLVADRAAGGAYRERLGLMTQIRQDFEVMAELLLRAAERPRTPPGTDQPAEQPTQWLRRRRRRQRAFTPPSGGDASGNPDPAGDELPRIDRIVLYIDDLDRCPARRVVEVLEAVHLLLAVRLFVVVLAVDPRWLLRSIAIHYRDLFDLDDLPGEQSWTDGPAQYLEKIFQIVLTLPPLDTAGYKLLVDHLIGIREDQQDPFNPTSAHPGQPTAQPLPSSNAPRPRTPAAPATPPAPATSAPDQPARRRQPTNVAAAATTSTLAIPTETDLAEPTEGIRTRQRIDPLALTADELRLMALLGPPLITSPRAVKRLTNSYGLLAAIRPTDPSGNRIDLEPIPDNLDDRQDDPDTIHSHTAYPYRAGMVLLAAVIGYPELGPDLFTALYHAARTTPGLTWDTWLRHHTEPPDTGHPDCNPHRLGDLSQALRHVATTAAQANLHLPRRLTTWAAWVVPVGRLSFPTGPTVTRLINTTST